MGSPVLAQPHPFAVNQNVAVLAHHLGCYWLNACRIVYVIDEDTPMKRFGFAYGTLDDHAASGEERFLVEWNRASDDVSYELAGFFPSASVPISLRSRRLRGDCKSGSPLNRSRR